MNFLSFKSRALLTRAAELLLGLFIFWAFLLAGTILKKTFHLILPANVLGMLLLLAAISLNLIALRWIELAGRCLLFLLPLLFVPIYVGAGAYKSIWIDWGWLLVPTLISTVIAMWIFVGHFTQFVSNRLGKTSTESTAP